MEENDDRSVESRQEVESVSEMVCNSPTDSREAQNSHSDGAITEDIRTENSRLQVQREQDTQRKKEEKQERHKRKQKGLCKDQHAWNVAFQQ